MMLVRRFLTAALLLPMLAAPALAVPVAEPLQAGPGNAGMPIGYRFAGRLGPSGIDVEAMPTMLMVTAIAPGSPGALMDLPSPERYRVRLAAINGRPVEELTLWQLQSLFNPQHDHVTLTVARKGPQDLTETFVGPFEVPLSSQAIAARQSRWLTAQRRFTEAHAYLADRQSEVAGLDDNLMLAARDLAAGGDYDQALELLSRVTGTSPMRGEANRLKARWQLAHLNAQLSRADALAGQGEYHQALAVLARAQGDESWRKIKDGREAQWKSAIAKREAYKAFKKTEMVRRARQAEVNRQIKQAQLAAYRREAIRRYQERARQQVLASREYQRAEAARLKNQQQKR
jgi:tetratricopeptide (TPR) repeat protein